MFLAYGFWNLSIKDWVYFIFLRVYKRTVERETLQRLRPKSYAKFRLHNFIPDFDSPTGFEKSQANRCSFTRVTIKQSDLSKTRSERIAGESQTPVRYLDLSTIQNHAMWNVFWLKITSRWPTANKRETHLGQLEVREEVSPCSLYGKLLPGYHFK